MRTAELRHAIATSIAPLPLDVFIPCRVPSEREISLLVGQPSLRTVDDRISRELVLRAVEIGDIDDRSRLIQRLNVRVDA